MSRKPIKIQSHWLWQFARQVSLQSLRSPIFSGCILFLGCIFEIMMFDYRKFKILELRFITQVFGQIIYLQHSQAYRIQSIQLYGYVICILIVIIIVPICFILYSQFPSKIYSILVYTIHLILSLTILSVNYTIGLLIKHQISLQHYYLLIPIIILLLLADGVFFLLDSFIITLSFQLPNGLSKSHSYLRHFINALKILIAFIYAFEFLKNDIVFMSIFTFTTLIQIYWQIKHPVYNSPLTSEIDIICKIFVTLFYFLVLISNSLQLVRQSFILTFAVLYLILVVTTHSYYSYYLQDLMTSGCEEVINSTLAIRYVRGYLQKIKECKDTNFLIGFVHEHRQNCTDPQCCCQKLETVTPQNFIFRTHELNQLLLLKIKALRKLFPNSLPLVIMENLFEIEIIDIQIKVLYQFKSFSVSYSPSHLHEYYLVYEMKSIHRHLLDIKYSGLDIAQLEKVLEYEKYESELQILLARIAKLDFKRWKMLSQTICNLNKLKEEVLDNLISLHKQVYAIYYATIKDRIYNLSLLSKFSMYFSLVLPMSKQVAKINKIMAGAAASVRPTKVNKNKLRETMFSDTACVVESIVDPENLGKIHNISRSCKNIFQITANKLRGKHINTFMPRFLIPEHNDIMRNWLEAKQQLMKSKIVHGFFIDINQQCHKMALIKKMAIVNNELRLYLFLIKEREQNYVLVDIEHKIQGLGRLTRSIFKLTAMFQSIKKYFPEIDQIINKGHFPVKINAAIADIEDSGNESANSQSILEYQHESKAKKTHQIQINTKSFGRLQLFSLQFTDMKQDDMMEDNVGLQESLNESHTFINEEQVFQENADNDNSSQASLHHSELFIVNQIMLQVKERALNKDSIKMKLAQYFCVFIAILSLLLIGSCISQIYLANMGLTSYVQVLNSDGSVSDNMQLIEFTFNKVQSIYQKCNGTQTKFCQQLYNSLIQIENYSYELLTSIFKDYLKNITQFQRLRLYSYLNYPTTIKIGNKTQQVETLHFIEIFHYSVVRIMDTIKNTGQTSNLSDFAFQFLLQNWPKIKSLNNHFLDFYREMAKSQLNSTFLIFSTINPASIVLMLILGICMCLYYNSFEEKVKFFLKINSQIPYYYIQQLKNFSSNLTLYYSGQISRESIKTPAIEDNMRIKGRNQLNFRKVQTWKAAKIISFFVFCFITLQICWTITINNVFDPLENIITDYNALLKSENIIVQAYFGLKRARIFLPNSTQAYLQNKQALKLIMKNEVQFIKMAFKIKESIADFAPYNAETFSNLLINDICQVTKSSISQSQYERCLSLNKVNMMKIGLVTTMDFFYRTIWQVSIDLQQNGVDAETYFNESIFEEIDGYLDFIFKVYQLIQINIATISQSSSREMIAKLQYILIAEILVIIGLCVFWIVMFYRMRTEVSNLFGQMLIFPQKILKSNKRIIQIMESSLGSLTF